NEPHLDEIGSAESDEVLGWNDLVEKTAREIRKIDPVKTIFIEGCQGGAPEGFYMLRPIRVSNVVYSAHMYVPGNLTHQGIYGIPLGTRYPNKDSDIDSLERALKPVIDFQKKWKVPIFVGEFGCVRWAPDGSAVRYISDCIEIFEKYGWDWCHHCYRDWQGWDPEYPEDQNARKRSETQTDTEKLLRSWFSKNKKPVF
ncbi:MAG: cellulase family glycosylhydrolase, partial [Spirochaetia bacterium]|nr:cellulase family glycosylhydrolase [Spirochaetia bacterium]